MAVGILLRTSNLIPFPQVTSFIMLVRRSLSNAGAKVVDYYIYSKLFTNYFSFFFNRRQCYIMYAQRRLKKYSSLTGTTRIFRFDHTVTLGFCLLISGHDFPFFYSFNIYRMNNTLLSNE